MPTRVSGVADHFALDDRHVGLGQPLHGQLGRVAAQRQVDDLDVAGDVALAELVAFVVGLAAAANSKRNL